MSLHIENINEAEVNLRAENKELKKVIEDQNAKLKFLETENFKLTEIEAERDEMDGVKMDFINALVELGFPYHSSLSGFIPAIEKLKKKETELTNIQPENINNREEMQHLNQKVEQQNLMIATKSKEIEEQNQKMKNMLEITNQRHEKLQDQLRSSKEAFQNLEGEHKKLETEIKDLRERNIYLERFKTMHQDFMLPNVETGTSSLGGKDECHLHDDIIKEKHATNVQLTEHIFHLNSQLDALRKENEKIKENLRHTIKISLEEVKRKDEEIKALQKEKDTMNIELEQLKNEVWGMKKVLAENHKSIEENINEIKTLKSESKVLENQINHLKSENQKKNESAERLSKMINQTNQRNITLKSQIAKLKKSIQSNVENSNLRNDLKALESEKVDLVQNIQDLSKKLQTMSLS